MVNYKLLVKKFYTAVYTAAVTVCNTLCIKVLYTVDCDINNYNNQE